MFESLFKGYDLRGIVPTELNEEIALNLGKAFATLLIADGQEDGRIFVARDNRIHSLALSKAFISGLNSCGINAVDIGETATPVFYYAIATRKANGAMLTASHNPKEYNGFKFIFSHRPMSGPQMQRLKGVLEEKTFQSTGRKGISTSEKIDDEYLKYAISNVKIEKKFKVVVDSGNGMGSVLGVKMLKMAGCEVSTIYCDLDGNFPNHQPDPHKYSTLDYLQRKVADENADLGIAFDGDVDRVGFVDDLGKIMVEDDVQIIFARNELKGRPGEAIVYDLRSSMALKEEIEKAGGKAFLARAGRLFIRDLMLEKNAVFAGELSGHYFFESNHLYDDGFFAALKFLEFLSGENKKLSEIAASIPRYVSTPDLRLSVPEENKFKIVEAVKKSLAKDFDVLDIDGVRINQPDAWGLLRASNTEPVISLRFEGRNIPALAAVYAIFKKELELHKVFLAPLDSVLATKPF